MPSLAFTLSCVLAQIAGGRLETLHVFRGADGDQLGWAVAGAGDLDGDGHDDLLLGAPFTDVAGSISVGSAYACSGRDGVLLWRFDGHKFGDQLGKSVAGAGDVDGDGVPDLAAGAPQADPGGRGVAGSVFVYSGASGAVLWEFDGANAGNMLGWAVAGAGDVNGDGHADLIAGAPEADPNGVQNAGLANVYSGADGSLLWRFPGAVWLDQLGRAVAGVGDVDGDGRADLLVGAPGSDRGGAEAGSALLYSGATGALLRQWDGAAGDDLGRSVAGAGDVDGDGVPDLLIGAPHADFASLADAGAVLVYSGASGALLFAHYGESAGALLGSSVSGAGDVDADGRPDFAAGAPADGAACVYSGADGRLLWRLAGASADNYGWSVAGAGDPDADGFADVLVGAPLAAPAGGSEAGAVLLLGLDPFLGPARATLSAAAGGTIVYALDFPDDAAGESYRLLASGGRGPLQAGTVSVPLSPDLLLRRSIHGRFPPALALHGAAGVLDAAGQAQALLAAPHGLAPAVVGRRVQLAAVCGVSGAALHYSSAAVTLEIAP